MCSSCSSCTTSSADESDESVTDSTSTDSSCNYSLRRQKARAKFRWEITVCLIIAYNNYYGSGFLDLMKTYCIGCLYAYQEWLTNCRQTLLETYVIYLKQCFSCLILIVATIVNRTWVCLKMCYWSVCAYFLWFIENFRSNSCDKQPTSSDWYRKWWRGACLERWNNNEWCVIHVNRDATTVDTWQWGSCMHVMQSHVHCSSKTSSLSKLWKSTYITSS